MPLLFKLPNIERRNSKTIVGEDLNTLLSFIDRTRSIRKQKS